MLQLISVRSIDIAKFLLLVNYSIFTVFLPNALYLEHTSCYSIERQFRLLWINHQTLRIGFGLQCRISTLVFTNMQLCSIYVYLYVFHRNETMYSSSAWLQGHNKLMCSGFLSIKHYCYFRKPLYVHWHRLLAVAKLLLLSLWY